MRIKNIIYSLVTVFLFASAAQAQDLIVGISGEQPPFNTTAADGNIYGFDAYVAKKLCRLIDANCTIKQISKDKLNEAVRADKVDLVISSVSYNDMSYDLDMSLPYFINSYSVIGQKSSNASNIEDLKGATIAVLKSKTVKSDGDGLAAFKSGAGADLKLKYALKNDVIFKQYDENWEIFQALNSGEIEYALGNTAEFNRWIVTRSKCCKVIAEVPNTLEDISIFANSGGAVDIDAIDDALISFIKSGELAILSRIYFGYTLPGTTPL